MSGMRIMFLILIIGFIVPVLWDAVPVIKSTVHLLFDPSLGSLLNLGPQIGFIIIVALLTLISTLIYKYTTDQKMLKEIKEEQKKIQEEMKQYRAHPEKLMEFQKKSLDLTMRVLPMTFRPAIFTIIPFILLFRWFGDYFAANPYKILGFMNWIVAYLVFSIIFSSIFRKIMKVS